MAARRRMDAELNARIDEITVATSQAFGFPSRSASLEAVAEAPALVAGGAEVAMRSGAARSGVRDDATRVADGHADRGGVGARTARDRERHAQTVLARGD